MTRTVKLTTGERRTLTKAQRLISRLTYCIDDLRILDDYGRPRLDGKTITKLVTIQDGITFIACTTRG